MNTAQPAAGNTAAFPRVHNPHKPAAVIFGTEPNLEHVFGAGRCERIAAVTELYPDSVNGTNLAQHLPRLRAVFYAAGSVQGLVVTNHLADKPQTVGLITGELLARMPDRGSFINTGRSATVRHCELIEVLRQRPDLTRCWT